MNVSEIMAALMVCASEALDPPAGRVQVVPGLESAWDDCCAGQVSVSLVSLEPRYERGCGPVYTVGRFGVEVVRCVATVDDGGRPPTVSQVMGDADRMVDDMEAVRKALLCCTDVPGVEMERWEPVGPSGGCAGGTWIARVKIL